MFLAQFPSSQLHTYKYLNQYAILTLEDSKESSTCLLLCLTRLDESLVAPAVSNNGQDVHEEVDDVQVEVQRGEHVLLGAERVLVAAPDHQLGVVHDVETEDDCPDPGVDQVQGPAGREEGGDQAEQHKTHQNSDEDTWRKGFMYQRGSAPINIHRKWKKDAHEDVLQFRVYGFKFNCQVGEF